MEERNGFVQRRPRLALWVAILLGSIAYAGFTFVIRGSVRPFEVGLFAVIFGVVFAIYAFHTETIKEYLGLR